METPEGVRKSGGCIKSSRRKAGTTIDVGSSDNRHPCQIHPSPQPITAIIPASSLISSPRRRGTKETPEDVGKSVNCIKKSRRMAGDF